jgi:hypothetical protein
VIELQFSGMTGGDEAERSRGSQVDTITYMHVSISKRKKKWLVYDKEIFRLI